MQCLPPKTKILLMGAFSTEKDLRREYRKMETSLPAYYADQTVLDFFKITKRQTPQILIFKNEKSLRLSSLTGCTKLKQIL